MHIAVPIAIAFILLGSYEASAQTAQPPIFSGPPGFALLTLVAGLGAYLPLVQAAARERYSKIGVGELTDWPLDASYTKKRLANLEKLQTNLEYATNFIFVFILAVALRLVAYAASVIPALKGSIRVECLYYWDLAMVAVLAVSLPIMWVIKYRRTKAERESVDEMVQARDERLKNSQRSRCDTVQYRNS
jgi:hypothetical protein